MTARMVRDVGTVFTREFVPVLRAPVMLVFTMAQPLLFLFLFGPLLGDAGTSWQWYVPGILIMMCLFGPMMSGYNLLIEAMGGSLERLLVTPLSRTAMLIGRTLKEFVILAVQAALIIGLALPLGFRLHPLGALAALGLLVVLGIGLGAFSFALALWSHPGGTLFWVVTQTALFPLLLLSGVLLPIDFGPGWLQVLAGFNPLSYVVEAERELFAGRFADLSVLYGTAAAAGIAGLGLVIGTRTMRRGI